VGGAHVNNLGYQRKGPHCMWIAQLRQGARLVQWSRHISHRPHLQGVSAAALDMSACLCVCVSLSLSLSLSVCLSLSLATYVCLAYNYVCIISTANVYILSVLLYCVLYRDCMKNCAYHVYSSSHMHQCHGPDHSAHRYALGQKMLHCLALLACDQSCVPGHTLGTRCMPCHA
jgi:hypothetical protein